MQKSGRRPAAAHLVQKMRNTGILLLLVRRPGCLRPSPNPWNWHTCTSLCFPPRRHERGHRVHQLPPRQPAVQRLPAAAVQARVHPSLRAAAAHKLEERGQGHAGGGQGQRRGWEAHHRRRRHVRKSSTAWHASVTSAHVRVAAYQQAPGCCMRGKRDTLAWLVHVL